MIEDLEKNQEKARHEEPKVRNPLAGDKDSAGSTRAYSLGMERVRPSKYLITEVTVLKGKTAELIDFLDKERNKVGGKSSNESTRLFNIAMEKYEEACMWAVKAVTKE
jgi:hypothetical protein